MKAGASTFIVSYFGIPKIDLVSRISGEGEAKEASVGHAAEDHKCGERQAHRQGRMCP